MAETRAEALRTLLRSLRCLHRNLPPRVRKGRRAPGQEPAPATAGNREALLAFYDFPAEHWTHLRTRNPIESTFATVRHRIVRAKGCLSNKTAPAMVFKLARQDEKTWRRLDGHTRLTKLIQGGKFIDGLEAVRQQPQAAA